LFSRLDLPAPRSTLVSGGAGFSGVAIGDFDGDGRSDLIALGSVWFANRGPAGTRAPDATVDFPFQYLETVDVNGDGIAEVLGRNFAYSYESFSLLLPQSDGSFRVSSYAPPGVGELRFADVDGDGSPDVVAVVAGGNDYGRIATLLARNGDPLASLPTHTSGGRQLAVAADFNGDGVSDVAIGGCAELFLSGPAGYTSSGCLAPATSLATGDFNGDGRPDLAVATTSLQIFLNVDGQLVNQGTFDGATAVVGDFNGNGYDDIAATPNIYWGSATGLHREAAALPASPPAWKASQGQLVLSERWTTGTSLWSSGNVSPPWVLSGAPQAVGDFNGDGRLDIIAGEDDTFVTDVIPNLQTGPGVFTAQPDLALATLQDYGLGVKDFEVGDFDGDGDLDFATISADAACWGQEVIVFWNDGSGAFPRRSAYQTSPGSAYLSVVDDNRDGKPDFVVGNTGAPIVMHNTCAE
jgi:hypothetical protein